MLNFNILLFTLIFNKYPIPPQIDLTPTISPSLGKSMHNFRIIYIGRKAEKLTMCIIFYCEDPLFVLTKQPMMAPC